MKRLGTGTTFGSREPKAKRPVPPPCFEFITLITYQFFLLLFACLACLCLRTLALTTTIARVLVLAYRHKVTRLNREGGEDPLVRQNQRMHQVFELGNNKQTYIYSNLIM